MNRQNSKDVQDIGIERREGLRIRARPDGVLWPSLLPFIITYIAAISILSFMQAASDFLARMVFALRVVALSNMC